MLNKCFKGYIVSQYGSYDDIGSAHTSSYTIILQTRLASKHNVDYKVCFCYHLFTSFQCWLIHYSVIF